MHILVYNDVDCIMLDRILMAVIGEANHVDKYFEAVEAAMSLEKSSEITIFLP